MSRYRYRVVHYNLSNQKVDRWELPSDDARLFVGGASLAARLLYDRVSNDVDPLDPSSPML